MIDGQVRGPGLAAAREWNIIVVGQVRGPGLAMARMYFVRNSKALWAGTRGQRGEGFKQPSGHLAGQWRQPPSFHRERKVQ